MKPIHFALTSIALVQCLLSCVPFNNTPESSTPSYGGNDKPPTALPGHCYAKCLNTKIGQTEWKEVLCGDKITEKTIEKIQTRLVEAGYTTPVNGKMGSQTKAALSHFQSDHKLPVGNLDLETLDSLSIKY
jgi:N-acetyl-anhydromuramyl-L-alanine amidase AmpD